MNPNHADPSHASTGGQTPDARAQPGPRDAPAGRMLDAMVLAMASMAEPGDAGHHILRIQMYVRALARKVRTVADYARDWDDDMIDVLVQASAWHDIGNSAIPDRILLKPGGLNDEELEIVRSHPTLGRDIIDQIAKTAGQASLFLDLARQITYGHQERWDGKGYPQGLAGDAIPPSARLMAIADAYDALTSDRVYRAGVAHDKAVQQIFQERGGQFGPVAVDAFIEIQDEFQDIASRYPDTETDFQKKIDYMAKAIAESP